jgi:hypothetical protein
MGVHEHDCLRLSLGLSLRRSASDYCSRRVALVAEPSSWPGVVGNALDKVPLEHFGVAFWVLLGVVLVVGLPFLRKLLQPAQTGTEMAEAVTRGIHKAINGDLVRISERLDRLERKIDGNRDAADKRHEDRCIAEDGRHEENLERFRRYERLAGRFEAWDGHTDRRKR